MGSGRSERSHLWAFGATVMQMNITPLDLGQRIPNPVSLRLLLQLGLCPRLTQESGAPGPEIRRLTVTTVNEVVVGSSIKK